MKVDDFLELNEAAQKIILAMLGRGKQPLSVIAKRAGVSLGKARAMMDLIDNVRYGVLTGLIESKTSDDNMYFLAKWGVMRSDRIDRELREKFIDELINDPLGVDVLERLFPLEVNLVTRILDCAETCYDRSAAVKAAVMEC